MSSQYMLRIGSTTAFFCLSLVLTLSLASGANVSAGGGSDWASGFNMRGTRNGVLALAHDGRYLYVGGDMNLAGGTPVSRIVRWDGSHFDDMDGGADMWVMDLTLDDNGALFASGYFTEIGGVAANRVARWDGDHWSPLGTGLDERVEDMVMDGQGNLYVGGRFATAGGAPASKIAMWDGQHWSAVGGGFADDAVVFALAVDHQGNLYASGILRGLGRVAMCPRQ